MSEHTRIKGKCIYDHIPYREEGFSYCKNCKMFADKLEICFNEGIAGDWMQVNCSGCGKAIWVCRFEENQREFVKSNKKCSTCKKFTSYYDCFCSGGNIKKKDLYWCSKKCYDSYEKNKGRKKDGKTNINRKENRQN